MERRNDDDDNNNNNDIVALMAMMQMARDGRDSYVGQCVLHGQGMTRMCMGALGCVTKL